MVSGLVRPRRSRGALVALNDLVLCLFLPKLFPSYHPDGVCARAAEKAPGRIAAGEPPEFLAVVNSRSCLVYMTSRPSIPGFDLPRLKSALDAAG